MPLCKTEAIVLHSRKQGETSKLLSLFTLHYGRLRLVAKGARGIKSHYGGAIETLNHIAIVFYRKETREVQYLSQAEILDSFPGLHSRLGQSGLAAIACEMVERHEIAGHANAVLFKTLLRFMQALEAAASGGRNIVRAFQLRYLEMAGFKPQLGHCLKCGREVTEGEVYFEYDNGGFRCPSCAGGALAAGNLSAAAARHLHYLSRVALEKSASPVPSARVGREMDAFILHYLRTHIESLQDLHALDYLKKLEEKLRTLDQDKEEPWQPQI